MSIKLRKVLQKESRRHKENIVQQYDNLTTKKSALKSLAVYRLRIASYLKTPYELETWYR